MNFKIRNPHSTGVHKKYHKEIALQIQRNLAYNKKKSSRYNTTLLYSYFTKSQLSMLGLE